jgi:hypothetical protein
MAKQKLSDVLKNDTREAMLQTTANKTTEIVQKFIVALIKKNVDTDHEAIEKYLASEEALALVQLVAGIVIPYVPGAEERPLVSEVSAKLRQGGMSKGMGLVVDEFLDLIPQLNTVISQLPLDEVAQLEGNNSVADHEEEDNLAHIAEARASRR